MAPTVRNRLARVAAAGSVTLAALVAAPSWAADGPRMAGSLPIERVIGVVRCNLDQALAATAKANMRLTVTAVDLHLSAVQSGKAVEVPAIAPGVDLHALEASDTADGPPVSTHAVDVHFVPFREAPSGPTCQTDIGLVSVVQSAIAALRASEAGTDRLVVDFAADFAISRGQDDKLGFLFLDRDREIGNLAVHSLKVELQLDRT
jgi:hypothetical protein